LAGFPIGSLAWLAFPLLKRQDAARKAAVDPDQVAAYERILQTVRDLDEDYLVGKLPAEQYTAERARWMEQGAAHLESLEKLTGKPAHKKSHHAKPTPAQVDTAGQDDAVEPGRMMLLSRPSLPISVPVNIPHPRSVS